MKLTRQWKRTGYAVRYDGDDARAQVARLAQIDGDTAESVKARLLGGEEIQTQAAWYFVPGATRHAHLRRRRQR